MTPPNQRKPEHLSNEFIIGEKDKLREQVLDYQARCEGALQEVKMLESMLSQAIYALSLVANPKRNDGTYNRCREACEVLANETLTRLNTMRSEGVK